MLRSRSRQDFKSTKSQTQSKMTFVPQNLRKLKLEGLYKQRTILDKLIQRIK